VIRAKCLIHLLILSGLGCAVARGQDAKQDDPKQIVQQAVQAELAASRDDHSRWLYFESGSGRKFSKALCRRPTEEDRWFYPGLGGAGKTAEGWPA
jgi:hypothetical protein